MNRPPRLSVCTWPEMRRVLTNDCRAYYIDRVTFWDIVSVTSDQVCEIPQLHAFEALGEFNKYWKREWLVEFETEWKPKLLNSALSSEPMAKPPGRFECLLWLPRQFGKAIRAVLAKFRF